MKKWSEQWKTSWYRSLSLLWIMIIALQWISYTEPIWLRQTTASVLLALLAVVLLELLLPLRLIYRALLEAAAVIYIVYRVLLFYGRYLPLNGPAGMREQVTHFVQELHPYIWFALGAWALLLACSYWVTTRARILVFVGANIAAFAALDSFTPAVLWQEVAWTVAACLGWLIANHLRGFQMRYPRGWKYLLNYPLKIVLNAAVICSVIVLVGVNMPVVKPTLTDPYTAWREWRGVGGAVTPGSGALSNVPGADGSGMGSGSASSSGYSNNDQELGGGFNFDYSPVMTVVTDMRTYMRGETRSVYSGQGWSDDDREERGPLRRAEVGEALDNIYASQQTQTLEQTVTIAGGGQYPVIFGGYAVSGITSVNGEADSPGLYWRNSDAELLWEARGGEREYPQSYTITSEVPVIPLVELSGRTFGELYGNGSGLDPYLQLPGDFPERVRELAEEITASAETPYEKALLLQSYLKESFPYNNQPDLTRKQSEDFVESFLFEIQEGYCDYYSTAFVTMARSLGIPARWVKGYAPGQQAEMPENMAMVQGVANNSYSITNADAHSWAEVYFGDYGWMPIEATPGFSAPLLTQNEQLPEDEDVAEEETPEEETPAPAETPSSSGSSNAGLWVTIAAAAVLSAWCGYLLWRHRLDLRFLLLRLRSGGPVTPDRKVIAETERWIRRARRHGMTKEPFETLRESVHRWSTEQPRAGENLKVLLEQFERAKYSPEVIGDKDWKSVYTEALRLRKALRAKV